MRREAQVFLTVLIVAVAQIYAPVSAGEQANSEEGYVSGKFQLDDDDLRDITSQVMAQYPLLSSSPGVKYAGAARRRRSQDIAEIIYYPHIQHAGIKQAFQVICSRQVPEKSWICDNATIRRYMALDSQGFEVRVTGPIGSEEAMALIEATREALPPRLDDGSAAPQTATLIRPYEDGYLVTWGNQKGHGKLAMWARLARNYEPPNTNRWIGISTLNRKAA